MKGPGYCVVLHSGSTPHVLSCHKLKRTAKAAAVKARQRRKKRGAFPATITVKKRTR